MKDAACGKPPTLEMSGEEIETSCGAIPVDTLTKVAREPMNPSAGLGSVSKLMIS
jgi:hypothetical protein